MLKGTYRDELMDAHGRVWLAPWRPNAIVDSCNLLLASLMKGVEGMQGILYWAVGSGEPQWDSAPQPPSSSTAELVHEIVRVPVAAHQISFLDDTYSPTEAPTDKLEVAIELSGDDLAPAGFVSLREFGVFGGDASDDEGSGLMIDYVVHPRIDLARGAVLRRTLRLTFATSAPQEGDTPPPALPPLVGFGADLPVTSLDGVGDEFGGRLMGSGVRTIGDLVGIDPLIAIEGIPMVRLREFRAKARLAVGLRVDLEPFEALFGWSISALLLERPESLARLASGSHVGVRDITRLQEQLAFLQVAMVDPQLQRTTLGQLVGS